MGCCSFIEDAIKDVGYKIDDEIINPVVEIVKDAADWVVDDIIEPVARGAEDIVDAALDDPIATIAKIAAVASGNAWALPLIDGAAVAAYGGHHGDVIHTAVDSYATCTTTAFTSKFLYLELAKPGL